LSSEEN